jgi:hypothetical protein
MDATSQVCPEMGNTVNTGSTGIPQNIIKYYHLKLEQFGIFWASAIPWPILVPWNHPGVRRDGVDHFTQDADQHVEHLRKWSDVPMKFSRLNGETMGETNMGENRFLKLSNSEVTAAGISYTYQTVLEVFETLTRL